jgi:hypothetical protein
MVVIAIAMVAIVVVMVILRKHRSAREHGDHGRICNYVANGFHSDSSLYTSLSATRAQLPTGTPMALE